MYETQTVRKKEKPPMNGIYKRKKTGSFAQIDNEGLQTLEDIRSIGVLGHLMSLPGDWVVQKMHLYKKYGKGHIEKAISELEQKKYWVSIKYRNGSRNHFNYTISDYPFSDQEVVELIQMVVDANYVVMAISEAFEHLLTSEVFEGNGKEEEASAGQESKAQLEEPVYAIEEDERPEEGTAHTHSTEETKVQEIHTQVCPRSITDFQPLTVNHSSSIVEKQQLINTERQRNREKIHNDKKILVNSQEMTTKPFHLPEFKTSLTQACHEYYPEYGIGRWNKKAWMTMIDAFVTETIEKGRDKHIQPVHLQRYAQTAIKNMVNHHDWKNGKKVETKYLSTRPVPFYNWLEEVGEEEMPY